MVVYRYVTLLILGALLVSCAAGTKEQGPQGENIVKPNQVVVQEVPKPVIPQVSTSYGLQNNPEIIKAYNEYKKTGKLTDVDKRDNFPVYPYSPTFKPIISCSPDHFCIVELEAGEKVNSYSLGDTVNWKSSMFLTGDKSTGSISIELKPVTIGLATDMTISTNKRTYLIGLVSMAGADTTVLRFYYPNETILNNVAAANIIGPDGESSEASPSAHSQVVSGSPGTSVNINNLNFEYKIEGDSPVWRPIRVYDDGNKTFIQMSSLVSEGSLPVLYLAKGKDKELINFRYKQPFFIVDSLFGRAWLISGKGSQQERVEIINLKMENE